MRLHRLRVTAFGPFTATQQVDFDALSEAGLFLLHGPTGAGKTSVLDAVCYALYGTVPGDRAQAHRLRSDHAPADLRPEVELEVTLRERRLLISRSPEWERPKLRGAGTTKEPARTLLRERRDGSWQTLSTRNDEAAAAIAELTGLNANQFTQVVLLPQGQFATFLRAKADDRAKLLGQLFATQRFTGVADWLAERRREGGRALEQAQQAIDAVVARILEAAGVDEPPPPDQDPAAWAGELATAAAERHDRAQDAVTVAREHRERHRRRHADMVALTERQAAYRRAREQAARLAEDAGRHAALNAELTAARAAQPIAAVLEGVQRAVAAADQAEAGCRQAHATLHRLTGAATPAQPSGQSADELRARARRWREEVGRLEELADDVATHGTLEAELTKLDGERAAVEAELTRLRQTLDGHADQRERAERRLRAATLATARADTVRVELAAATDQLNAAADRDELQLELTGSQRALADATDQALTARAAWLDARAARLDGMAAELAGTLVPGAACPVCGSDTHPRPAEASTDQVDVEAEQAAQHRSEAAERERARQESVLGELRERHAAAQAKAGERTQDELAAAVAALRASLDQLSEQAADRAPAEAALAKLGDEQQADRAAELELRTRHAQLARATADLRTRLAALARTLDAARGQDPDIPSRQTRIAALADAAEHALAAMAALDERVRQRADAQAHAERQVAAAGFADLAAARAALRDETWSAEAAERLLRHEREQAAVQDRLADPDLAAADRLPPADPDHTQAALADADAALAEAEAELARALDVERALRRLREQLDAALRRSGPLRERHERTQGLANLVNGTGSENSRKMTLPAYVLAARLEQVTAAASDRLARMSSGRYTIAHSDAVGRGRSGLGLRVRDAWTGLDRDPATLSGGESFVTALALALGLADVVSAEAGGAELETLFIDEGFGSLDADALEEVMDVLDALRDRGRVVGLVSHVAELRGRIPARLLVHKTRSGSVLRQDRGPKPGTGRAGDASG
jgi:exonuclease SbcC